MAKNSPKIQAPIVNERFRVIGGCVFVSFLSLIIANPFKQAIGVSANCPEDHMPATLIINTDGQISPACLVVMTGTEESSL